MEAPSTILKHTCLSVSSSRVVPSGRSSVVRGGLVSSFVLSVVFVLDSVLVLGSIESFLLIIEVNIGESNFGNPDENLAPLTIGILNVPVFRSGRGFGALGRLPKLATVVVLSS